ncbi:MAG: protein kinase domain-containing protein, partial [Bryobacteraceae bacterium]
FIVMEYVAGKTLDELIPRKGLRVSEVLKYAVQIADALSAAHAARIIHRDLKPSNLIVTENGLLKVLDFGLVKLTEPVPNDPSVPTQSMHAQHQTRTEEGTIVGTAAYMSPEQAQGLAVDARSDIFSFGAVLYEMLTGHRAFHGETNVATLSAVLRNDPPAIRVTVEGVPPELERITARCLHKDPNRRFQHVEDLKVALQELKDESDSGKLLAAPRVTGGRLRRGVAVGVAAGILLTASVGALVGWLRRSSTPPANLGLVRLTSDSGLSYMPALSVDGRLLAYASDRGGEGNMDIWVKQVAGGEPVRLTKHPAADLEPAFSPDGTQIAFRSEREGRGIYVVSALGGDERRIADFGAQPRWSPDGRWISYGVNTSASNLIYAVPSTGGSPRQLAREFVTARPPIWSPDGKHLLFSGSKTDREHLEWWVTPFEGAGASQTDAFASVRRYQLNTILYFPFAISSAGTPAAWLANGNRIVFSAALADSRNIWTISIAPPAWKATGEPQRLTFGTGVEISPSIGADRGGQHLLAFANITSNKDVWSLAVDHKLGKASGELERLTRDTADDHSPFPSPDGTKVAFISDRSGRQNVWLKELSGGRETALDPTAPQAHKPILARDGSKLAYQVGDEFAGKPEVRLSFISREGQPGVPERVCGGCARPVGFSTDGQKVFYVERHGERSKVIALDLASGQKTELVHAGPVPQAALSPDGGWLLFTEVSGPRSARLWIAPLNRTLPVPQPEWILVSGAESNYARQAAWAPDGNLVYMISEQDAFRCIWAQRLDARKHPAGPPLPVKHFHGSVSMMPIQQMFEVGLNATRDKLFFSLVESSGNIWLARIP